MWTVEPGAVRDAARACAQVAQQLGHPEGASAALRARGEPAARAGGAAGRGVAAQPAWWRTSTGPAEPTRAELRRLGDDLLGEVLLEPDPLDRVELALEPVGVRLLVADHLLEHRGRAVVAEVVALLGAGVELRDGGLLARRAPARSISSAVSPTVMEPSFCRLGWPSNIRIRLISASASFISSIDRS